jgi:hypothetical protein
VHLTFVAINEKINDFVRVFNAYKKCGFTAPLCISNLNASVSSSRVVTPDKHHPPLRDLNLTLDCYRVSLTPHRNYTQGDYLLHCNVLRHADWCCVPNENFAGPPVNKLSAILCRSYKFSRSLYKIRKFYLSALVF